MPLYSFDVFDTCLVRNLAQPSDIFLIVAEKFRANLEPILGPNYRAVFRDIRSRAEITAREKSPHQDITLSEIWSELVQEMPVIDRTDGIAAELEAERAALKPNPAILRQIRHLEEHGKRIIYVSDIYLTAPQLADLLKGVGFPVDDGTVYTSGEIGLLKKTGDLFRHVLEKEDCRARDILHTGDNDVADIDRPRALGLKVRHVTQTRLTPLEDGILQQAGSRDALFFSRLAGEMQRMRLDGADRGDGTAHEYVSAFLGPVLFLFGRWMSERAAADNVQRLCFMSRDLYRLHRMALQMPRHFSAIDCRYFYVSRRSVNLPSLSDITPEELGRILYSGTPKPLASILELFELDPTEAGEEIAELVRKDGESSMLCDPEMEQRLIALLCQPPLRERIAALCENRRRAVHAYMDQEGLFGPERTAFADIGWKLTVQTSLAALLRQKDPNATARGYYLAIEKDASFLRSGVAEGVFYQRSPDIRSRTAFPGVFDKKPLLEGILGGAPHGSVTGYELDQHGVSQPVFDEADADMVRRDDALTSLCEVFAARLDSDVKDMACEDLVGALGWLIETAVRNPDPSWVSATGWMPVSSGAVIHEGGTMTLHRPLSWTEAMQGRLMPRPWAELDLAAAPPAVQLTYRTMRRVHQARRRLRRRLGRVKRVMRTETAG